jgi:hypothetical protein
MLTAAALLVPPCGSYLAVPWHPDHFIETTKRDARFFPLGEGDLNPAYPDFWPYFDGWSLPQYDPNRYALVRGYVGGRLTVHSPIERGGGLSPWSAHWSSTERCDDYAGFCDIEKTTWCVHDEEWYWVNRANGAWGRPFLLPLSESAPLGDYQVVWFVADRIPLARGQTNLIEMRVREYGCAAPDMSNPDGTVVARTRITTDPDLIILPVDVYVFGAVVDEQEALGWFGQGAQHTRLTSRELGEQCRIWGSCYEDVGRHWFRSTWAERLCNEGRTLEAYRSLYFDRMGERIDLIWAQCGIQFDPVIVHPAEGSAYPPDCIEASGEMRDLVTPGRINVGIFEHWLDSPGCSYGPPIRVAMTTTHGLKQYGHWSHGSPEYGVADEMTNEILAHEIGHNLSLDHVGPPETGPEDRWNLMWASVDSPYGGTRLTAAQCAIARAAALAILAESAGVPAKAEAEVKP